MTSSYRSSESASRSSLKRVEPRSAADRPRAPPTGARAPSPSPGRDRGSFAPPSYHASPPVSRRIARSSSPVRATGVDVDRPRGEPDRVGDPVGARAAVADDRDAAQPEQDRAAGGVRVHLAPQAAQRRAQQQPADIAIGFERAASPTAPATAFAVPSSVFRATLPVKPSVTITSAASPSRSRPSTLPRKSIALGAGELGVGLDHVVGALLRLLADREQRDARALDPEHGPAEGGAQVGELDEVAGARLGVGADVEQDRGRPRRGRARRAARQRRAPDAVHAPQRKQRGGHRRPRRPGARERLGAVRRRRRRRRGRSRPRAFPRTAATGSSSLVISSGAATTSTPSTPSSSVERRRIAEDADGDAVGRGRLRRPRRSRRAPARRRGRRGRRWSSTGSGASTAARLGFAPLRLTSGASTAARLGFAPLRLTSGASTAARLGFAPLRLTSGASTAARLGFAPLRLTSGASTAWPRLGLRVGAGRGWLLRGRRRVGLADLVRDHLAPRIGAAHRADAVRQTRAVAARALVEARRGGGVGGAPLVAPGA